MNSHQNRWSSDKMCVIRDRIRLEEVTLKEHSNGEITRYDSLQAYRKEEEREDLDKRTKIKGCLYCAQLFVSNSYTSHSLMSFTFL